MTYTVWTSPGAPLGGVMDLQNGGGPPHWLA